MVNLEYLIIYTNDGIPIYSRCFADLCKVSMRDDVLFSAFLAALNQFAQKGSGDLPRQMDLEGIEVLIEYSEEKRINTIKLEDLELIFYYTTLEDVTIAAGINARDSDIWQSKHMYDLLLGEVEKFLIPYQDTIWSNIGTDFLLDMESKLLSNVVHPFFETYDMKNRCGLGDNCPYRLALYEGKGISIFDKLGHKVREISGSGILTKIKLMMFSSKYKLSFT